MRTLTNILVKGLSILMMICSFSSYGQVPLEVYEDRYSADGPPLWSHETNVYLFIAFLSVVGLVCLYAFIRGSMIREEDSNETK